MYDLITACKSRVALTLDKATCVGILDVDVDAYEDFSKDKCLILVIIHLNENIMMIQTNYLLVI